MSTLTSPRQLPVAVIGAGPVGLAAAAHLLERAIEPLVLEAAPAVGANLLNYGHVPLFSPWRYNLDNAVARALSRHGWQSPDPDALPLAREVVERVLAPYVALDEVKAFVHCGHRVIAIARDGFDKVKSAGRSAAPFTLRVATKAGVSDMRARAVIDASGTWTTPNPLGANGLPARGEEGAAAQIHYGIPDVTGAAKQRYLGKRVLVVGAGHSAANALLSLAELADEDAGTRIAWALRGHSLERVFGGGAADALPARGRLGSQLRALQDAGRLQLVSDFRIASLVRRDGKLAVHGHGADAREKHIDGVDEIICATGQRPDLGITRELRLKLDPWLESTADLGPLIDPNLHSCGTVRPHGHRELSHPEAGFYTVGVKSYGRAPTFLMTTGFEQVRSVAAALAGDLEAADRVELVLPETGVCNSNLGDASGGCGVDASLPVEHDVTEPAAVAAEGCCRPAHPTTDPERELPVVSDVRATRGKPVPIRVEAKRCC